MHPVLAAQAVKIAGQLASVSQADVQASPNLVVHAWSAQQVIEHLILTFEHTGDLLTASLRQRKSPSNSHSLAQWLLKSQIAWFGAMPRGVPSLRALRPGEIVPQNGDALAARFLAAAEEMDRRLVASRKTFGLLPCAVHPIYGSLRVEEWRQYHAIHCRHHLPQLREAIAYARSHADLLRWPVAAPVLAVKEEQPEFAGRLATAGRG